MDKSIHILLIDDDQDEYFLVKAMFADLPGQSQVGRYVLTWAHGYEDAISKCKDHTFDLYLIDYFLGKHTGLEVMRGLRELGYDGPFILLTGQGSYELDLIAMQHGVADFLLKDQLNAYLLERSIRYALERQGIQEELERLVQERTVELSHSEERFRSLAETTSAAIFIVQDRVIRYTNPAVRYVTGYGPEELEGMELWRLAHPAYQGALQADHNPSWAAGMPHRFEVKIIHRSGEERWLDMTSGQAVADGKPAQLLTAFDITERDRAERELRRVKENLEHLVTERTEAARASEAEAHQRAEELDGLQRATSALLSTLELDEMFSQILSAAHSAIPAAEKGLLCLMGPSEKLLAPSAVLGYADGSLPGGEDGPAARCMAQAVLERNPVLVTVKQPVHKENDGQNPGSSWIASPLIVEDQVLGVLALGASGPKGLQAFNLRLLASFAAAATTALQNAMLHGEMKRLAESDPLTGKYNRRAFFDLGDTALWRARRSGQPVAAIMIDLDNFKQMNDHLGHSVGDSILREVADRCRSRIRESDVFGRYGGDEFAILLPGASMETAAAIAWRILDLVAAIPLNGQLVSQGRVSISVGVAGDRPDLVDLSALINEADRAMYTAKQEGKGRVQLLPNSSAT